jgi:hypothetical protein
MIANPPTLDTGLTCNDRAVGCAAGSHAALRSKITTTTVAAMNVTKAAIGMIYRASNCAWKTTIDKFLARLPTVEAKAARHDGQMPAIRCELRGMLLVAGLFIVNIQRLG